MYCGHLNSDPNAQTLGIQNSNMIISLGPHEDKIARQDKDFHQQKTRCKSSMIRKMGPSKERDEEALTCGLKMNIQIK